MAAIVCAASDDGALLHFPLLPIKSGASISLHLFQTLDVISLSVLDVICSSIQLVCMFRLIPAIIIMLYYWLFRIKSYGKLFIYSTIIPSRILSLMDIMSSVQAILTGRTTKLLLILIYFFLSNTTWDDQNGSQKSCHHLALRTVKRRPNRPLSMRVLASSFVAEFHLSPLTENGADA
jgi:hypothetical protein